MSLQELEAAKDLFPRSRYDLRCYLFPQNRTLLSRLLSLRRPHSYMFGKDLKENLSGLLAEDFDILHLEQLWTGWLGLKRPERSLVNIHHLGSIDLSHSRDSILMREHRIATSLERKLIPQFHHYRTLTSRLEEALKERNPLASITTVPIGLDLSLYPFLNNADRTDTFTVSLIGTMNWYPTASAARRLITRLWPEIKRRVPQARLRLIGWNARESLREYLGSPDVEIAENVVDIRCYFDETSVLLYAPERATGMKIKVLEALALGVPVVTTHEGVEGLAATDGIDASICDDDSGLIDRTVRLLLSRDAQNRQAVAGRRLVESTCGPENTVAAIERIYTEMLQQTSSNKVQSR